MSLGLLFDVKIRSVVSYWLMSEWQDHLDIETYGPMGNKAVKSKPQKDPMATRQLIKTAKGPKGNKAVDQNRKKAQGQKGS